MEAPHVHMSLYGQKLGELTQIKGFNYNIRILKKNIAKRQNLNIAIYFFLVAFHLGKDFPSPCAFQRDLGIFNI